MPVPLDGGGVFCAQGPTVIVGAKVSHPGVQVKANAVAVGLMEMREAQKDEVVPAEGAAMVPKGTCQVVTLVAPGIAMLEDGQRVKK